jgi:hypothetical protein
MSSMDQQRDLELSVAGNLLYEYAPRVTQVIEYGTPADVALSGQTAIPSSGIRLDLHLEGPVTGSSLNGTVKGVDYLYVRADGRAELHIHAAITTESGKKVALAADGVAIRQGESAVFDLRENVTLLSSHPEFSWLNGVQIWASGTVDMSSGQVQVSAYVV